MVVKEHPLQLRRNGNSAAEAPRRHISVNRWFPGGFGDGLRIATVRAAKEENRTRLTGAERHGNIVDDELPVA